MPILPKKKAPILKVQIQFASTGPVRVSHVSIPAQESRYSCRATRLVDDSTRFLLVKVKQQRNMAEIRVEAGVKVIIDQGLTVEGMHFAFLGYTDSQLKAGHLTLFREGNGWTVQGVLDHCGKLQDVYVKSGYGKYSARLGLSFSSTLDGLNVPPERALQIADIKAADGSVTTDGIGMIADTFARQQCLQLGIPEDTVVFQIRRGGIKGLLVRYPDKLFYSFCGVQEGSRLLPWIAYRPSMVKYEGGPTHIEISGISGSTAARTCLNQQFISLLLTLAKLDGHFYQVFQSFLKQHLDRIQSLATDRERAITFLCGSAAELDSASTGLAQELLEMLYGKHDMDEPVLAGRIQRFQNLQYTSLREKFRIDVQESCWLYGVVDELGVLNENEVYVNISRSGVQCRKMVVGRSPAYSPGDIRVLQGVDRPELSHLKHCIGANRNLIDNQPVDKCVILPSSFSQALFPLDPGYYGRRYADGDLDGDKYWVCWDPCLIPDRMESPEERIPAPKVVSALPLDGMKTDAARIFAKLRGSHLLGTMSKAWVGAVEANPSHLANDPYARALVPLLEAAMDMAKTGDDADLLQQTFESLRKERPRTLRSDQRGPFDILREDIPKDHKQKITFKVDPELATPEYNEPRWREHYDEGASVMKRFNLELLQGVKHDDLASESNDGETVEKQAELVRRKYTDQYFPGHPGKQDDERLRASAWYTLGYHRDREAFAWLGARYLHRIKAEKAQGTGLAMCIGPRSKSMPSDKETSYPSRGSSVQMREQTPETSRASSIAPLEGIGNLPAAAEKRAFQPHDPLGFPIPATATSTPISYVRGPRESVMGDARRTSQPLAFSDLMTIDKPSYPVATPDLPACSGAEHRWGIRAGGTWRNYTCQNCSCIVKEKRRDGIWCPKEISGGLSGSPMDSQAIPCTIREPAESAPIRNLKRTPPSPAPNPCDPTMDKPAYPVATLNIPACPSKDHTWRIKAGGTWRHYTCTSCQCLVKEKRREGIWRSDTIVPPHRNHD